MKRVLLVAVGLGFLAAGTKSEAADSKLRPGLIVVAKVEGTVEAIDPVSKSTYKLKKSDTISEKYTVNVGADSTATLAFSNGAIINLLANTTMVISEFLQDPFSSPFAGSELSQEPTTSVTKLQLVQGEMVGTVKKLRTEQGSSLIVNTPVGAAGVRGTTLAVSYSPGRNGNGTYTLSVTEGSVEFTDANGKKTLVEVGQEIVIKVTQIKDKVTGIIKKVLDYSVRKISDARQQRIDRIAETGKGAGNLMFVDFMERTLPNSLNKILDDQNITIKPPDKTTETDP